MSGALLLTATAGFAASAATAPKPSSSQAVFFLRQEGCGTTAEAGRLDPKKGTDGATGCGTIGGLPIQEIAYQVEGPFYESYDTGTSGIPVTLNGSKKITGQIAVGSWIGNGTGGLGTVTVDLTLTGKTATKSIDFGATTVDTSASPGEDIVMIPFEFSIPSGNDRAKVTKLSLGVMIRGANIGMTAYQLDGDSYLVVPIKK